MVNIRLLIAAAFLLTALSLGAFAETAPRSALSQGATTPSATVSALYLPYVSAPDAFPTLTATSTMTPVASSTATATPTATRTPTALPPTASSSTPSVTPTTTVTPTVAAVEWTQHAHDAQHTSYHPLAVPTPWRWKWAWNGPTASGGVSPGKFGLPRNSQPVTGGGRVYLAAGANGVYALDNATGAQTWHTVPGAINATPAYDGATGALFVLATDGTLYKLNATTGAVIDSFAGGVGSTLPLPPAIAGARVYFASGNAVYALATATLQQLWRYDAGSPVDAPPAFSATRDFVVVATRDLHVHAIRNSDGSRAWRTKTTVLTPGDPGSSSSNSYAEVSRGWPVIAEQSGIVLVKLRLDWQTLWDISPWPATNAAMRSALTADPTQQTLLAVDLDDGSPAFIPNVGAGGFGDGAYLPMGPQPVVKRFANGSEVAYVVMRGSPCSRLPCDGRYDSHLGELLLSDGAVAGYAAGDVRFMQNTFFPTDEQPYLAMAGDQLLAAHWEAGLAHTIVDRSPARGSGDDPIRTANLPHITTSQDTDVCNSGFLASHACAAGLSNTRQWPGGFYIYWQQGAVYDQFWSEFAGWVVSNGAIYYVSTDGAVIALEHGAAAPGRQVAPPTLTPPAPAAPAGVIDHTAARAYAGRTATVEGVLHAVFNNGKAVYLTFQTPHQGAFLARILKANWPRFGQPPATRYAAGQRVRVTGRIGWYQGDPVINVTAPGQIRVLTASSAVYLPAVNRSLPPTAPPTPTSTATRTPTITATPIATPSPTPSPTPIGAPTDAALRRVNAPYFAGDIPFGQMAILWFGRLSERSNYADVRVGYNATGLTVYLAAFDRRLWYDATPAVATLTDWDAVTLLIDTETDGGQALDASAYRFVAQLSGDPSASHRAAYRGSAQGWQAAALAFATRPGWRGNALNNDDAPDRGWAMTFDVPFAALGLDAAPANGAQWRIALQLHDRDGFDQAPEPLQFWPEALQPEQPATWGVLHFGLPAFVAPSAPPSGAAEIRRPTELDSAVPDANVGGVTSNQCPGDEFHIWNEWAERNYGHAPDFNIQNQSDVADWPCFAKYYVTFPLTAVPPGKVIVSATLTLFQFGNAGGVGLAQPSWIQVLTSVEDWEEDAITWNNAPLAAENIGGRWVTPITSQPDWPGIPWQWDVSYAVAQAYAAGAPLRLILYAADSDYHSGKYFVSSDTGDWNTRGRPVLRVAWGEP